jgi:Spy/CpxP family protein refolding chaperone
MFNRISTAVQILAVAGCLVAAPTLSAQDSGGPPQGGRRGGPGMMRGHRPDPFKGITLTEAQKTRIDSIHKAYRTRMDSLRTANTGDRSAFRTLMESQGKDVRGVLTADQQKVYDANVKAMQEQMQKWMRNRPAPPPPPQQ